MNFWSADNLQRTLGGRWLVRPRTDPLGVSTDTRTLRPGEAFVALKGPHHDGHAYLAHAAAAGAPLAIIDTPHACSVPWPAGLGLLQVPATPAALLDLARAWRRTLAGTVLAVAGSAGKTTTVRLLQAVLDRAGATTASARSFNNHIGVPLTLLSARASDRFIVCEVGTSRPGEIAALGAVVAPCLAIITSIGHEHLEWLGSLAGVAREEASLLEHVAPQGAAVIPADTPLLFEALAALGRAPARLITVGESPAADLRIVEVESGTAGTRFALHDGARFDLPLLGRHNARNAAMAVAAARSLGLTDADIAAGLLAAPRPPMRLEPVECAGVRVLNDAYNAHPDSMSAALDTFLRWANGASRRVVILGDMLELGPASPQAHASLGRCLDTLPLDLIVLAGSAMRHAADALRPGTPLRYVEALDDQQARDIASLLRPGDAVLLKASRGMRLERVLAALSARCAQP